jgi:5'-3' exoribonuclease 2
MRNDIFCKILGIDSIQLKMYDGTIRMLTNVRHVPKLRNNLIYLGFLDSSGYKCTIQGVVLKLSKGILLVMKAKRIRNLYQLEGRTESNQAGI